MLSPRVHEEKTIRNDLSPVPDRLHGHRRRNRLLDPLRASGPLPLRKNRPGPRKENEFRDRVHQVAPPDQQKIEFRRTGSPSCPGRKGEEGVLSIPRPGCRGPGRRRNGARRRSEHFMDLSGPKGLRDSRCRIAWLVRFPDTRPSGRTIHRSGNRRGGARLGNLPPSRSGLADRGGGGPDFSGKPCPGRQRARHPGGGSDRRRRIRIQAAGIRPEFYRSGAGCPSGVRQGAIRGRHRVCQRRHRRNRVGDPEPFPLRDSGSEPLPRSPGPGVAHYRSTVAGGGTGLEIGDRRDRLGRKSGPGGLRHGFFSRKQPLHHYRRRHERPQHPDARRRCHGDLQLQGTHSFGRHHQAGSRRSRKQDHQFADSEFLSRSDLSRTPSLFRETR